MSNIFKSVKGQVLCSWDIEEVKSWKPEQNFEGECGFEEWSYRKIKSEFYVYYLISQQNLILINILIYTDIICLPST